MFYVLFVVLILKQYTIYFLIALMLLAFGLKFFSGNLRGIQINISFEEF